MDDTIVVQVVVEHEHDHAHHDATAPRRIANVTGFVSGAAAVARLHQKARLVGVSIGADEPEKKKETEVLVRLSMEELVVGVVKCAFKIVVTEDNSSSSYGQVHIAASITNALHLLAADPSGSLQELFAISTLAALRVRVFVDLWTRGHFVAFGSKFGVDFLLYQVDPSTCHSSTMVLVKDYTADFATVEIVSHCRVAKMVKKQFVIASQQHNHHQIVYMSLDHAVLAAASAAARR